MSKVRSHRTRTLVGVIAAALIGALISVTPMLAAPALADSSGFTVGSGPFTDGFANVSAVSLNGTGTNTIDVLPGADVTLTASWADNDSGCPGCVDFIDVGLSGQAQTSGCLEYRHQYGSAGTDTVDVGAAPTTPGVYNIIAAARAVYNCGDGWDGTGTTIAQVRVSQPATHLAVTLPSTPTIGNATTATVTALDASNNPAYSYTGTVHVTSSDSAATLPADVALVGGSAQLPITFATYGPQTVTVTDIAAASFTSTAAVNVGYSSGFATISNVSLNGTGLNTITVQPGTDITLSADWRDNDSGCPGCIDFIEVGYAGQAGAGCLENHGGVGSSGNSSVDLGSAPLHAGVYNVVASALAVYYCGQDYDETGTTIAQVTVLPGPLNQLHVSTGPATAGVAQTVKAEAFDAFGNDLGDATAASTFAIDGGGTCVGNTCTATVASTTVTATDGTAAGTASLTVAKASTTTVLPRGALAPIYGSSFVLSATVATNPANAFRPTGTVSFYANGSSTPIASAPVNATTGIASASVSGVGAGNNTFTAVYSGDGSFAGSTAAALQLPVAPKSLQVVPQSVNTTYGTTPTFPVTVNGLVGTDSIATAPVCGVAAAHTAVGQYTITCSGGQAGPNYTFDTSATATLTVAKAVLTVTPANATRLYGQANPTLTAWTISGYKYTDTASAVSGSPALSTTATVTSNPGAYPITATVGSLTAANYSFAFAPGTLTINAAGITVTPKTVTDLASLLAGRVTFTATVTNTATGALAAGVSVTFSAKTLTGYTFGCTAVSTSAGVASCTSINVLASLLTLPATFTATAAAGVDYLAGSGSGRFALL